MALTMLDPRTALLVVDLQKGVVEAALAGPIDAVVDRAKALIDGFRSHRLPVVLIAVAGVAPGRTERPLRFAGALPKGFTDILPALDRRPDDIVVTKHSWGAFATTDLEQRLKAIGVTQVVVAGVATETGVESTARQAYEAGFHVTLAIDAMTDPRREAHEHSIAAVFPRLGETGTTRAILDLLSERHADHAMA
jgi:nicotinamidase-related amidase